MAEAVLQAMASPVPDKTIAEGSGSGAITLVRRQRRVLPGNGVVESEPKT